MNELFINIQVGKPEFLEEYRAVFLESVLFERYFSEDDRLRDSLRDALERRELLVAESGGEIVAVMEVRLNGFFGAFPYLALLGVKKGWRGMGIGHQMLRFFEEAARELGHRHISIMVSTFNPRARNLYQSYGFQKIGSLKDALKEGIEENILVKTLR